MAQARIQHKKESAHLFRESTQTFLSPLGPGPAEWRKAGALPPLTSNPPEGATFIPPSDLKVDSAVREAQEALSFSAGGFSALKLFYNADLNLIAEPGEGREDFRKRCEEALIPALQREGENVRKKFEQKLQRLREQAERERQKMLSEREEADMREQEGSLNTLEAGLGSIFGGRNLSTKIRHAASGFSKADAKRPQNQASESQIQASRQKLEDADRQIKELEAEIEVEARRIRQKYAELAAAVTEETVTPDRKDVRVEQVSLVWLGQNEVNL
jgi:hypothetical protein